MKRKAAVGVSWGVALLLGLAACDRTETEAPDTAEIETAPAGPDGVQTAYADHGARIELTGKAAERSEDGFLLDYGVTAIRVHAPPSAVALLEEGQELKVLGIIDRSGREPVIEAAAILTANDAGDFVPLSGL